MLTCTAAISVVALFATGAPAAFAAVVPAAVLPTAPGAALLAPYYTELDLTGDDMVTEADLDLLSAALGTTSSDAGWPAVSIVDLDADGVITVVDVAALSQRIVYDDGPFTLIEASSIDMQAAMNDMVTTGGCACWSANQTSTDAFMVQGLREAGAVILAKASLDEFAYGFA